MKGYPKWFLRALAGVMLLAFVTGGLLAPTTLVLRANAEIARLPGSARVLMAALHAVGGFALALLMGALWSVHMRAGWRRRRQRASGLLLSMMILLLMITAVAIYYLGDEAWAATAAFVHLATGLALAGPFGWHWVKGRRARREAHAQRSLNRKATHLPTSSHRPTHKANPTP
ncbi:hypothetical protein [Aquabacterium sp.]|uniref:hypothetical protein n=1 Tax=Aquabacterium sp. TaxID=1872578 RepID=UPI00248A2AB9|nr:hypothetical protein [Aquabacterium sp.]MDI1259659.1 hypothetical protein [Aquabacterium sp.]